MPLKRAYFVIICIILLFSHEKTKGQTKYEQLRSAYENLEENDEKALPFVEYYIEKAKQEKNHIELVQGFEDLSYYSKSKITKVKYADSAIVAAHKTNNNDKISEAYLYKGSLHYFYFKNYKSALAEYLQAYQYSEDGKDEYLRYKVIYQMGLVKSYLGYYDEALVHFKECIAYFELQTQGNLLPNEIYNNSKGYLNSLHQAIVCYRNLGQYKEADSLLQRGLNFTKNTNEFPLERAYFKKSEGILDYQSKKYNKAIANLSEALPILKKNNDFSWVSVADFYIGKSYLGLGKTTEAVQQFEKVDSIFQKHQFITPELRENYEQLITYWKKEDKPEQELLYTKSLIKVDSIINKDFTYLSAKIHKDYDTKILEDAKDRLGKKNAWGLWTISFLAINLIVLGYFVRQYYKREKEIKTQYQLLEQRLQLNPKLSIVAANQSITTKTVSKSTLNDEFFTDLEAKLKHFEETEGFVKNGLTLSHLAEEFDTNTTYLSQYINDVKETNFNKYLAALRINYITQKMYDDQHFLKITIQGLADSCGIGSRQSFSDQFLEINGIRPTDFIKERKKELKEQEQGDIPIVLSES